MMVIFNSYVKLPEGNYRILWNIMKLNYVHYIYIYILLHINDYIMYRGFHKWGTPKMDGL